MLADVMRSQMQPARAYMMLACPPPAIVPDCCRIALDATCCLLALCMTAVMPCPICLQDGKTAMHLAVEHCWEERHICTLIKAGAKLDVADKVCSTFCIPCHRLSRSANMRLRLLAMHTLDSQADMLSQPVLPSPGGQHSLEILALAPGRHDRAHQCMVWTRGL